MISKILEPDPTGSLMEAGFYMRKVSGQNLRFYKGSYKIDILKFDRSVKSE